MAEPMLIAKQTDTKAGLVLLPSLTNRHGLVAGATGTGKTVTLQVIAEALSRIGVPVFAADVKGDLSGISQPGQNNPKFAARLESLAMSTPAFAGCPVTFWDVFGEQGHPVRATISEMGPLLLGRILNLNDTQAGVLTLVFKIADDEGLLLLDLKDLRAMLQHAGDNAAQYRTQYGNISAASIGAIQRGLIAMEQQGGDKFFGEPALNIDDLLQTDQNGHGVVNILAADKLMQSPKLYATFLLWLLSELFERLPEVGDPEKPKLVFFFDEAHLLFNDLPAASARASSRSSASSAPKASASTSSRKIPTMSREVVLSQLGNRVQHALRAFTPIDQKAVKAAADTFRTNPKLDTATVITQLAVGEALVSFSDETGTPGIVQRAWSARLPARSAPSRPSSVSRSSPARPSPESTKRPSIASPPTNASPTKRSRPRRRDSYNSAIRCSNRHRRQPLAPAACSAKPWEHSSAAVRRAVCPPARQWSTAPPAPSAPR